MAVTYVELLWSGRRGRDGIDRKRDYVQVFEVRTDDPYDDPTVAGGTILLPRNGDPYPTDPAAFMVDISPDQMEEDPTLWRVTCRYSTDIPRRQAREAFTINPATGASQVTASGADRTAREENPLDRPAVWSTTYEQSNRVVTVDKDLVPVVNSANRPFDPPVEDEESYLVLTVTKNYADLDLSEWHPYQNSVNSDDWASFAVRTLWLFNISFQSLSENNVNYWQATFNFKYKETTWDKKVLDAGYYDIDGNAFDDPTIGPLHDRPTLMDGAGARLSTLDDPFYHEFRIKPEKDFDDLELI